MDSILLFPPGASGVTGVGSAIQLGSWLNAGEAGDLYGAAGLIQSMAAENALRDGGVFEFRHAPVRHMHIPLIVNTPSVVNWEGLLARYSTPGAYIAVQPEGIPSSQAVYFDVIDGRWEPAHNTFENRARVRKGTLHLDTQPYGYWPTEILLASSASVGILGTLPINGASVIGDVAALAHVTIAPTAASFYSSAGGTTDIMMVSLGGRPSFLPFIPAGSMAGLTVGPLGVNRVGAGLIGDKYAPGSQAWAIAASQWAPTYNLLVHTSTTIASANEPAYRGRFRVFALAKNTPSFNVPINMIVDSQRGSGSMFPAMASGNTLASVYSVTPTMASYSNNIYSASPAYSILDCGEITMPAFASGLPGGQMLRVWFGPPTSITGATVMLAGLYLLPVDGPAGIIAWGLTIPTVGAVSTFSAVEFNANWVEGVMLTVGPPGAAGSPGAQPVIDARAAYRGLPLKVSASTSQLTYLLGDKIVPPNLVAQGGLEYAYVSVSYRPSFQFLYGV